MKKELILNNLIKTYLNELSPISSGELKRKCDLPFSPSTIRNYFQKLDGEGMIIKVHISSGSVPSTQALRDYWYRHLDFAGITISKSKIEEVSKTFDVFISIKEKETLRLKSIWKIENRFIVLDFGKDEIVLKYSKELFYLFNELLNYSLEDIKKVLKAVALENLLDKFSINKVENFNREFLYRNYKEFLIDDLLDDKIFDKFQKGLSFNKDFLAYNIDVNIDNKKTEFIILGDIHNNYIDVFKFLKEVG
jgi:heat-inducible transcriptional repressor